MKISSTFTILAIVFCSLLSAQNKQKSGSTLKEDYIKNQGYLSKKSDLSLKNMYGDSLKGFDEDEITIHYMNAGAVGAELQGLIALLKRQYINRKYNINQPVPSPYSNTDGSPKVGKTKGGSAFVNVAPCVNEGFEQNAPGQYTTATGVTGWTIESRSANSTCGPFTNWVAGSPVFTLQATPLNNWPFTNSPIGIIPHSPLGGTVVAQMNDQFNGDLEMTRIRQTFPVSSTNALFQFAYAGYWELATGHNCCQRPGIDVKMYDCTGNILSCVSLSLFPGTGCNSNGVSYTTTSNGDSWSNWQVKTVDFTPYIGTCITVEFMTTDCSLSGHWGCTLLDVMCGGQNIGTNLPPADGGYIPGPVSYCAGSGVAIINAPNGYNTYQWVAPGTGTVPAPQGTMSALTITNPVANSVYTVYLVSASGCQYVSTNTIMTSTVGIAGLGSSPTCPNGSSGSATVAGNGSGAGYTYTWVNTTNSVVGTQSVVSGLSPGIYSVTLGGLGSAGCGTAVSTVTIGVQAPSTVSIFKPYCGNEAYLQSPHPGTNFKWYNNTTLITSTLGTLPNYTVTSPCNSCVWWVSYTTNQGCKDSVRFTLVSTPPGLMTVPPAGIKLICPSASNGTATINMSPANGAPAGFNTYSVVSSGTTAPYTASLGPVSANVFTVNGLSPGTYSVQTFDGSCKYNTVFNVVPLIYDFTLTPVTPTLCPGNSIQAGVVFSNFPLPNAYTYSWSPTNWLVGGNGSFQNTIITPTGIPNGAVVTTVYTIAVTPAAAPCTIKKTISITAVNPPTPTFTAIDPMCNTFAPYQIQATPGGGTFTSPSPGLVGVNSGIITPSLATFGQHTFTYAINVNTCIATNTSTFEVSQYFTAALTSTIAPLCVTSPVVNLMNIVQNTTNGQWLPAPGVQGNIFNSSQLAFSPSDPNPKSIVLTYSTNSSPNPTVCAESSTVQVVVTNTSVPFIAAVDAFCTNASPITMTVSPSGGGWSGSNISASGIITPSNIVQPGQHAVTYTVNHGPCLNTASTSFNVSKFNTAQLLKSILPEQCADGSAINLMTHVQSTVNGTWSGPGVNPATSMFSPANMGTSIYTLTYNTLSSPDPNLCKDVAYIQIPVLNPQTPSIADAGPLCSADGTVQLSVIADGGHWTTTAFLNSDGVFIPSQAAIGNNAAQYVVGTPTCFAQQTKFINVEAFVSAELTKAQLPPLCNSGAAVNLMPYTYHNTGGWSGPGIIGTSFDPELSGMGDFELTYTTSSIPSGLCPDQAMVTVSVFSLQTPNIQELGPLCNFGTPVQLNADVQGGLYGGANTNAVDKKGLFIPASGIIGPNVINYTITSGPCVAYAQTTINVERFVSADFHTEPSSFCKTDQAVNMNHYVVNPGGTWSGPGIVGDKFFPAQANAGINNEITYETHSLPTASLCPDKRKVRIKVVELPELSAVANKFEGCAPLEVWFNTPNVNQAAGKVEWIVGDGTEEKEGISVNHIYTSPGTYSVLFNYSLEGCKAQVELSTDIVVHEVPRADFTIPEEVLISDPAVHIVNNSTPLGGSEYTWLIEGQNDITEVHPQVVLPEIGKYKITLIAVNENGCKDEIVKTLEVKNDFNIFIPSSFSPNFDQLNDEFRPKFSPYGLDLKSFEMEVYDRWGHRLYRTTDLNKGWDGSVDNKGEPLKEGVYVYKIRYKDLDGNSYNKTGHLTLLR